MREQKIAEFDRLLMNRLFTKRSGAQRRAREIKKFLAIAKSRRHRAYALCITRDGPYTGSVRWRICSTFAYEGFIP